MKKKPLDIAFAVLLHPVTAIVGFVSLIAWRFDVVLAVALTALIAAYALLARLWRRLAPVKERAEDDTPTEPVSLRDD